MQKKSITYILKEYEEITIRYDIETAAVWCYFNPKIRPSFSMKMLEEMYDFQLSIIEYFQSNNMHPNIPIRYLIVASQTSGVFNYGGDLNLFSQLIINKERQKLYDYAKMCIDVIYLNAVNLNLPITTISLIEGTALGGGFEAALSSDILIAEEGTKMGLPEIRFNLFPGMGAYSLLARSLGTKEAENIITSGKVYDSQTLYEKGVITILAEPKKAKEALDNFIKEHAKSFNGMQAIRNARHRYEGLEYSELLDITKIWVDAALRLEPKDLKVMNKLTKVQSIKANNSTTKTRTKQDRRISTEPVMYPFLRNTGEMAMTDTRRNVDRRL